MFKSLNLKNSLKIFPTSPRLRGARGFTLVELLLYMTLLTGFLILLTRIFSSTLDTQFDSEAQSAIQQDSRTIISRLSYDIHRATSVTTPTTLGGSGSTLVLVIAGENYTYTVSGTNLILTTTSQPADPLNSVNTLVSGLNFKRLGNPGGKDTIQMQFTLTSKVKRLPGADVKSFQTTVGLR